MKNLDFIVIGAQKCATTTLFELLRQHPDVRMPIEKEVPFFTGDDCAPASWDAFAKRHFGKDESGLWGKVSPQYMANADIPARIAASMPQTKLIAVLRDPLERTRSHFRMGQRRATEDREFSHAMREHLHPTALATARAGRAPLHTHGYESEADYYLVWSEYGRILRSYRNHFPSDQMLVLYTEDLEQNPRGVLERVLNFLELDTDFHPRGLGEVMHAGGSGTRIPNGVRAWLRQQGLIAALWHLVPAQQQGRLRFLYERWNNRQTRDPLLLDRELDEEIRMHFANDLQLLRTLQVDQPPWLREYTLDDGAVNSQNAKPMLA